METRSLVAGSDVPRNPGRPTPTSVKTGPGIMSDETLHILLHQDIP